MSSLSLSGQYIYRMKLLTLFLFFIYAFSGLAQEINSTVKIESIDSKGIKKEINGQCVNMSFVKLKNNYNVIIIPKEFLNDVKELKVFLKQESRTEPFVVSLSIDQIFLAKTKKLAGFPFFVIKEKLQNVTDITYPTFVMEEYIKIYYPEVSEKITKKEVADLKEEIEKQLTQ